MEHELLQLIEQYVDLHSPYKEKRDRLLQQASERERVALLEFVGWFPEED